MGFAQSDNKGFNLKVNMGLGHSSHFNKPLEFPVPFFDLSLDPKHQYSNIGYVISLSGLKVLNKYLSVGLSSNISKFGFTEIGNNLFFGKFVGEEYRVEREFKMYGVGVTSGIDIIKKKQNKLSIYANIMYEEIISTEGIYLWSADYHKTKFAFDNSIEYGHLITSKLYLLIGLTSTISLGDFFEYIEYRPIRYGISVGCSYDIN